MEGHAITTVAPSTTASALTSLATGLAPSQHGIVGFRMRVDDDVLNVLRWTNGTRRAPDPFNVQRHTAFLGREVPVVTRTEFRNTGFTDAHLRGGRFVGWHAVSSLVEHCHRLVSAGERFVYAYYPDVDTVAHEFGLHDTFYERELEAADALVGRLLDALPPSCRAGRHRRPRAGAGRAGRLGRAPRARAAGRDAGGRRPLPLPVRASGRCGRARGRGA